MTRLAMALAGLVAMTGLAWADADGPDYWRVAGVAADDVLNVRAGPDAGAEKLGELAPDADGLRNLGCEGGLSFAEWEKASKAERAEAAKSRWCRISTGDLEGWVAGRYLAEGAAPAEEAQMSTGSTWRIASVDGAEVMGETEIRFADGGISGSAGCNRFSGAVSQSDGKLVIPGPLAATRMACPPDLMSQEDRVLKLLSGELTVGYDLFTDMLQLEGAGGRITLRRP